MPNLKKRDRKLPETPNRLDESQFTDPFVYEEYYDSYERDDDITRSSHNINDIELCRSVSIKDRKKMLEHYARKASLEQNRHWRSLPSLDQSPQRRAGSGRHWQPDPVSRPTSSTNINRADLDYDHPRRSRERSPHRPASIATFHGQRDNVRTPVTRQTSSNTEQRDVNPRRSRERSPRRPASIATFHSQRDNNPTMNRPTTLYDDPPRVKRGESPYRTASITAIPYDREYGYPRSKREQSPYRPASVATFQREPDAMARRSESPLRPSSSAAYTYRQHEQAKREQQYSKGDQEHYKKEKGRQETRPRPQTLVTNYIDRGEVGRPVQTGERRLYGDLVPPKNMSAAYYQTLKRPPSPAYRFIFFILYLICRAHKLGFWD